MRCYALLPALLLMAPPAARADCSFEVRTDMERIGMSEAEIAALCAAAPEAGRPAAGDDAFYCATRNGYCPLPAVSGPGRDCSCDTAYGPVPGVTE